MLSYCLKCTKNTKNTNPNISVTSNCKTMTLSHFAICGSIKSKVIKKKKQVENDLLNRFWGIKIFL